MFIAEKINGPIICYISSFIKTDTFRYDVILSRFFLPSSAEKTNKKQLQFSASFLCLQAYALHYRVLGQSLENVLGVTLR